MDSALELKIIRMLMQDPSMILLLKNKYVTDNMWKTCLENESSLIEYIDDPSEEMCMIALSDSGSYLIKMIERGMEITPDMILLAIESYPAIIFKLPSDINNDFYIEKAIDVDPSILLKLDEIPYSYVIKKIPKNPSIIKYIQNPSEEMLLLAIKTDPNTCAHIKSFSPAIREFIEKEYSDMAPMLLAMYEDGEDIEWEE